MFFSIDLTIRGPGLDPLCFPKQNKMVRNNRKPGPGPAQQRRNRPLDKPTNAKGPGNNAGNKGGKPRNPKRKGGFKNKPKALSAEQLDLELDQYWGNEVVAESLDK
jgi:hypothetical protein